MQSCDISCLRKKSIESSILYETASAYMIASLAASLDNILSQPVSVAELLELNQSICCILGGIANVAICTRDTTNSLHPVQTVSEASNETKEGIVPEDNVEKDSDIPSEDIANENDKRYKCLKDECPDCGSVTDGFLPIYKYNCRYNLKVSLNNKKICDYNKQVDLYNRRCRRLPLSTLKTYKSNKHLSIYNEKVHYYNNQVYYYNQKIRKLNQSILAYNNNQSKCNH